VCVADGVPAQTLLTKLTTELARGTYECMICVERIQADAAVWSCRVCYALFHLRCVRAWAQRSGEASGGGGGQGWRCPGCQGRKADVPTEYRCFCGKVRDPERSGYLTPHACGDACGRTRDGTNCPHRCTHPCHPGPCPPCTVVLPARPCYCGATTYTVGCGQPDVGRACGRVCDRILPCGNHRCPQLCHPGPCAPCAVTVTLGCYGGHTTAARPCGDERHPGAACGPAPTGYFACAQPCAHTLSCGNHTCTQPCHAGACAPCALAPEAVTTCPCGQVPLTVLLTSQDLPPRTSCRSPIPTCGGVCGRPLACGQAGHTCTQPCHTGACTPCRRPRSVSCRCGNESRMLPCATVPPATAVDTKDDGDDDDAGDAEGSGGGAALRCQRTCRALRSCGRHQCHRRCCPGKAVDHVCPLLCSKRLQCGLHTCDRTCHRGHCGRCMQTIYEELVCPCGRTFLVRQCVLGQRCTPGGDD
jgi:transcriptional repressor NF-X1